jgi:hypothetical protein
VCRITPSLSFFLSYVRCIFAFQISREDQLAITLQTTVEGAHLSRPDLEWAAGGVLLPGDVGYPISILFACANNATSGVARLFQHGTISCSSPAVLHRPPKAFQYQLSSHLPLSSFRVPAFEVCPHVAPATATCGGRRCHYGTAGLPHRRLVCRITPSLRFFFIIRDTPFCFSDPMRRSIRLEIRHKLQSRVRTYQDRIWMCCRWRCFST